MKTLPFLIPCLVLYFQQESYQKNWDLECKVNSETMPYVVPLNMLTYS